MTKKVMKKSAPAKKAVGRYSSPIWGTSGPDATYAAPPPKGRKVASGPME